MTVEVEPVVCHCRCSLYWCSWTG